MRFFSCELEQTFSCKVWMLLGTVGNLSVFRVGGQLSESVLHIFQGGTHGTTELFRLEKAFRLSSPAVIPAHRRH